ncbi:eamA domain, WAT1-related protein [Artemisia annua]|uniref:WAT1-related protein n=1 Tax=Artemisia annua TaxID=35608 RepID=A0A2U1PZW1_ARTAN|nr:eamA domain, WAT1-related protein [Artemisia annua]
MGSASRICYKDILPFASMVLIECIIVGGNTLFKSATSQDINSYVFTTYVFIVGFMFLVPCAFIVFIRQRRLNIPPLKVSIVVKLFVLSLIGYFSQIFGYVGIKYSSPTLSSVMSNLAPAFTFILAFFFRMEKLNLRSNTSQAKIVGTVVSISGALVATLYNGTPVTVSSDSSSLYWIIGGILLASQNFLLSFVLVSQAQIMMLYPVELMVVFVFGLSGLIVAAFAGLIMVRDLDSWKLKPDMMLASIIYMGISTGFLNVLIQVWALRLKGPVYVAMFKPFSIVVAVVMGVIFLGDSLHLGSVIGGIIISIGFYAVLWGKAKEDNGACYKEASASGGTETTPLLQDNAIEPRFDPEN